MSINDDTPASNYGTHLLLRLSEVENKAALDSPHGLCDFLTTLVRNVGMRVLDGPRSATETTDSDRYGHSAVVILYESHAAIHTYPARHSAFLDLFSCKPFDDEVVVRTCHEFLGHFDIAERLLLDRGTHWNGTAESNMPEWLATRDGIQLQTAEEEPS